MCKSQDNPTGWHAQWWALSFTGAETRRWAFYSIGAMMCAVDTGKAHGPAVSCRHERATRPGMDARRGLAADRAYRTLLFMGAEVTWRRVYDTGKVHGPALPTGSQLCEHPGFGFGAYVGPWTTRAGKRTLAR
jgi:hypothetical protein